MDLVTVVQDLNFDLNVHRQGKTVHVLAARHHGKSPSQTYKTCRSVLACYIYPYHFNAKLMSAPLRACIIDNTAAVYADLAASAETAIQFCTLTGFIVWLDSSKWTAAVSIADVCC